MGKGGLREIRAKAMGELGFYGGQALGGIG